jgi:transglutaminase-like putative cysteine protease
MLFRIRHETRLSYDLASSESHNEVRMRPRDEPGQRCLEFALEINPHGPLMEYDDYFGNRVHAISIFPAHDSLTIVARSLIEKSIAPAEQAESAAFRDFLKRDAERLRSEYDFLNPSCYVPFSVALRRFFWMVHPVNDEDVAAYVHRAVAFIRDQFDYEPGVTLVHSTADEILKVGGGVCQDFAHLTIGVLRLAGVPARYVSGYLTAKPGQSPSGVVRERASHAWIEAKLPGLGWTGFDPTHGCRVDHRHIKLSVGRDYSDVPPMKGVYRSAGGKQALRVHLDIEAADEPQTPDRFQSQQ